MVKNTVLFDSEMTQNHLCTLFGFPKRKDEVLKKNLILFFSPTHTLKCLGVASHKTNYQSTHIGSSQALNLKECDRSYTPTSSTFFRCGHCFIKAFLLVGVTSENGNFSYLFYSLEYLLVSAHSSKIIHWLCMNL